MGEYQVVEICAGAGGQSLGIELAGFEHELSVELDPDACATLRHNRPHWKVAGGDVADLAVWNPAEYAGADLLAGGVPCPPFTIAGRQLGATDERDLFAWAVELCGTMAPRALLLENVRGLSLPRFAAYRQHVLDRLAEFGYAADWRLLHASDFGVPQLRPRFVLVAMRPDDFAHFSWPQPAGEPPTVGETLRDLMAAHGWAGAAAWAERASGIAPTIVGDASAGDLDKTARDQIESAEQQLYTLAETGAASSGLIEFSKALTGAVEMAAEAYSRDGGLSGLSTGLVDLDQKLGGLHGSDLIIIAARPSMGKSSLAANIAFNVARRYAWEPHEGGRRTVDGGVVAFFSLEMSSEQLAMRLLAEVTEVPSDKIRKGEISAAEFGRIRDAAAEINELPLFFDDTGGISMAKLAARSRRLKRTVGLDLIVVDYLQLITAGEGGKVENRVQEVSQITQGLKSLAKELKVPVIALAQLSRQVENREDKKPQLADLRESGSIEQDADVVMFIYREAYYMGRLEPKEGTAEHLEWQEKLDPIRNVAEVIIGKQRHGPIGVVRLHFNEDLTKFSNYAREGRWEAR